VLPALASKLSNGIKGAIGEGASITYNWLRGNELIGTQVKIPGFSTIADSAWKNASGALYYVESKFGTSTLTKAQRTASNSLGSAYQVERWGYDWVGDVGSTIGNSLGMGISSSINSLGSFGAAGGYVLYPNKPDNNVAVGVYQE